MNKYFRVVEFNTLSSSELNIPQWQICHPNYADVKHMNQLTQRRHSTGFSAT